VVGLRRLETFPHLTIAHLREVERGFQIMAELHYRHLVALTYGRRAAEGDYKRAVLARGDEMRREADRLIKRAFPPDLSEIGWPIVWATKPQPSQWPGGGGASRLFTTINEWITGDDLCEATTAQYRRVKRGNTWIRQFEICGMVYAARTGKALIGKRRAYGRLDVRAMEAQYEQQLADHAKGALAGREGLWLVEAAVRDIWMAELAMLRRPTPAPQDWGQWNVASPHCRPLGWGETSLKMGVAHDLVHLGVRHGVFPAWWTRSPQDRPTDPRMLVDTDVRFRKSQPFTQEELLLSPAILPGVLAVADYEGSMPMAPTFMNGEVDIWDRRVERRVVLGRVASIGSLRQARRPDAPTGIAPEGTRRWEDQREIIEVKWSICPVLGQSKSIDLDRCLYRAYASVEDILIDHEFEDAFGPLDVCQVTDIGRDPALYALGAQSHYIAFSLQRMLRIWLSIDPFMPHDRPGVAHSGVPDKPDRTLGFTGHPTRASSPDTGRPQGSYTVALVRQIAKGGAAAANRLDLKALLGVAQREARECAVWGTSVEEYLKASGIDDPHEGFPEGVRPPWISRELADAGGVEFFPHLLDADQLRVFEQTEGLGGRVAIRDAVKLARQIDCEPTTVYRLWREIYRLIRAAKWVS
jgi:hypothetical protein